MDLSPPSLTRSPASSTVTYCPSDRSSLEHPSPLLLDGDYQIEDPYCHDQTCSLADLGPEACFDEMDSMSHAEWTSTVLPTTSSSPPIPNILSTDYNPFTTTYDAAGLPPPYGQDVYHAHAISSAHSPVIPATAAGRSPGPSSSARTSLSYHRNSGSVSHPLTPRGVKLESPTGAFGQTLDVGHYPSPRSVSGPYVTDASTVYPTTTTAGGYLQESHLAVWPPPKQQDFSALDSSDFYPAPPASDSASSAAYGGGAGADGRRGGVGGGSSSSQVRLSPRARLGKTRKVTTKEDANFQCEVKGCGKYFSRSYNYKAHMETHDEKRAYPFPCPVGDCNKRFVRKTDLQRHHQSVHMKERNHKCDFCGRLFARKDTLRRYGDLPFVCMRHEGKLDR